MKRSFLFPLLAAGLLASPALAQQGFRAGPTLGATLATAHFTAELPSNANAPLQAGFLAGLTGAYQSTGHWGGQAAVLYVQQGYGRHFDYSGGYELADKVRLNYLRVPLQATFSQHAGGQGWRLVAGAYAAALLSGSRTMESTYQGQTDSQDARVVVADTYSTPLQLGFDRVIPGYTLYSRRFDVGLQGGVGYRLGNALLQVDYTLGLRNLATTTVYETGTSSFAVAGEPYRTRSLEASLTYLFGSKG